MLKRTPWFIYSRREKPVVAVFHIQSTLASIYITSRTQLPLASDGRSSRQSCSLRLSTSHSRPAIMMFFFSLVTYTFRLNALLYTTFLVHFETWSKRRRNRCNSVCLHFSYGDTRAVNITRAYKAGGRRLFCQGPRLIGQSFLLSSAEVPSVVRVVLVLESFLSSRPGCYQQREK